MASIKTEDTTVPTTGGAEETRNEDATASIQVSISNSQDPTGRLIDSKMTSNTPPHEGSMEIGESEEDVLLSGHKDDNLRVAVEGVDLDNDSKGRGGG